MWLDGELPGQWFLEPVHSFSRRHDKRLEARLKLSPHMLVAFAFVAGPDTDRLVELSP
jgi:hypothetical protein